MDGALIIDKPAGITSHDVVARVRRLTGERSVGHLGTLDPAATGVLPLLLGRLTRLTQFFQSREKEYEGEIIFGQATSTYDAMGEPVGQASATAPSRAAVEEAMGCLRGRIRQLPPPFSAKKIGGQRAYELARRHQPVELAPVEVEVREFTILERSEGRARFRVRCSTGTYVRSLAHDLGQALGVGAHLGTLRRTRVGEFGLERAVTLTQLEQMAAAQAAGEAAGGWETVLVPALELLPEYPPVVAPLEAAGKILQGRAVNLPEFSQSPWVRVFAGDASLLAMARRVAGTLFQSKIVFPR